MSILLAFKFYVKSRLKRFTRAGTLSSLPNGSRLNSPPALPSLQSPSPLLQPTLQHGLTAPTTAVVEFPASNAISVDSVDCNAISVESINSLHNHSTKDKYKMTLSLPSIVSDDGVGLESDYLNKRYPKMYGVSWFQASTGVTGDGVRRDSVTSDGVRSDSVTGDGGRSDGVTDDGGRSDGVTGDDGRRDGVTGDDGRRDSVTGDDVRSDAVRRDGVTGDGGRSDRVTGDVVTGDGGRSSGVISEGGRSDGVLSCGCGDGVIEIGENGDVINDCANSNRGVRRGDKAVADVRGKTTDVYIIFYVHIHVCVVFAVCLNCHKYASYFCHQ